MSDASPDNLFAAATDDGHAPLAARMRPRRIEEIVGQQHLLAPGALLRQALDSDRLPSLILCGPAGCGKSTLASVIARVTQQEFVSLSAVTAGVAEIRQAAREAQQRRELQGQGTIVFIDEIHRLNKSQQDSLLPHVEQGTFTLIGATTENPFFSLTTPLRSRCRLYVLEPLTPEEVTGLLQRALADEERGLGKLAVTVDEEALQHLAEGSGGDARTALSALELAVLTAPEEGGRRRVTLAAAEEALQRPVLKYDRAGDEHYDTISAFIKAMRGSDPDAAIYWLAKMLEAGEDARFIARRIVIQAAEDVGLADPTALRVAIAAADAVEYVGLPEAQIPLAMATIHLATAPKSNSAYLAIKQARADVAREGAAQVPGHLAGGVRPVKSSQPYLYPHDYPGHYVAQDYLPPGLAGRQYYHPGSNRREQLIAEHLKALRGEAPPRPKARTEQIEDTNQGSDN
jgi:putative ATPase